MPTYEYICDDCGHTFTVMHKITEKIEECEKCKTKTVSRLLSPVTFILSGSGWYKDGYSSGGTAT